MQLLHNNPSSVQKLQRIFKYGQVANEVSPTDKLSPAGTGGPEERGTPRSSVTIKGRTEEPPHLNATRLVHRMTLATCQPRRGSSSPSAQSLWPSGNDREHHGQAHLKTLQCA